MEVAVSGAPAVGDAGNASGVDPATVHTLPDLAEAFQRLRGRRSYAELDNALKPNRGRQGPRVLPPSTLNNLLHGKSVPTRETVVRFLTACGLDEDVQQPWLAAWERVATAQQPRPRLGNPISGYTPLALEVHRAIELDGSRAGLPTLPAYVRREHDDRLREVVDAAVGGQSAIVTLVGGSSTGKTRACWEAIQRLPVQWRLWHPIDQGGPQAAAQVMDQLGPHTVVWLNEVQHYLLTADPELGERIAAGLRTVLASARRAPVLIMATLWPQYWSTLTSPPAPSAPDRFAHARELLAGSDIRVPDAFTGKDLESVMGAAAADPRLRHALRHAESGRITQHLAGVPELLQRYRNAPPAARAVIDAAIDARRMGHPIAIPHMLLECAAPGYLTDHEWEQAGEDWLEEALAYTAKPCHGTPGPLVRIRPRPGTPSSPAQPCYRLSDYLEQTGRHDRAGSYPPDSFWDAVATTVSDPDVLRIIADHASRRGRHRRAAQLYRMAAQTGSTLALIALAYVYRRAGNTHRAEQLIIEAADRGDPGALWSLSRWREQAGDSTGADALARQAAERGVTVALRSLAELRQRRGDRSEAEALYQQAADLGDAVAVRGLAQLRERAGDLAAADTLYRQAADLGDTVAMRYLAELRERAGDRQAAEAWAQRAADRGDAVGLRHVGRFRERRGDLHGAEAVYRRAMTLGDMVALRSLIRIRQHAGDLSAAELLVLNATGHHVPTVLRYRAELRAHAGDRHTAEVMYRQAADAGDHIALRMLARAREEAGDTDAAAALYLEALNRGDTRALRHIARLRETNSDATVSQRLRRFGLDDDGGPSVSIE